ncbi:MAG: hypothetical protein V1801_00845 [Candidatus Falkowbacteria bacterium]
MIRTPSIYNPNYFDGTNLKQMKARVKGESKEAFKTYQMRDGTLMGLFQGDHGARPDIDFVIKVLVPGKDKKLTPPTHTFWVVDLLLKIPQYKKEVREIVQYYINFYNKTSSFSSVRERNNYQLETVAEITARYAHIEQPYTLSLDYVATIIEFFCKNEKATPGAYMFRNLLLTLRDYIDGKKHYTEVLESALPLRR